MDTAVAANVRDTAAAEPNAPVIAFEDVTLAFDDKVILDGISFTLLPGRLKVILGASGSGKSTILRLILGLLKPDAGKILVGGQRIDSMQETELMAVRSQLGMVFQEGALFDSLTVGENVGFKLYEETDQPLEQVDARVREVLGFVGLAEYADRMPSELSGGQRRRVAIARALAYRPRILLYDEPTTGLDPITALTVDEEIIKLRDLESVSAILVTHQLRDAFYAATQQATMKGQELTFVPTPAEREANTEFLMLRDGRVAFTGSASELRTSTDPYLQSFLS
ncbi:MAG: ATP-binding cassette domain-containing protein [Acidobacteriota bacterium]